VPVSLLLERSKPKRINIDSRLMKAPRADTTLEALASLKPHFTRKAQ